MSAVQAPLKAPLPYFGGKSRAAELIWSRFGDVQNYVDPFCGSLAVLLARPTLPKTETVNDLDGLLSNMWRAVRLAPDSVAYYADQPVAEVDLTARHLALVTARIDITERLMADPEFYDPKLAGWYMWGACNWIGSGWCSGEGPWSNQNGVLVNRRQVGEFASVTRKLPHLGDAGKGVSRQLPHLGNAGCGVSAPGIGVNRKVPYLASAGVGDANPCPNPGLYEWMNALSTRLRRTRICCGDWTRVLGDSVTTKHGMTAVLLDPPYAAEDADNDVYGSEYDSTLAASVRAWALENGSNPLLRIAYCSYGDAPELEAAGWEAVPWKARKGYQNTDEDGGHNGHREVVMFSPACLRPDLDKRISLFGGQP